MNQNIDELTNRMYEKFKNERHFSQLLIMRHAGVDFNTADLIFQRVWRRLRDEARKYAEEVYSR